MNIAAMSSQFSQADLQYQVSVAVLKMAMEGVTGQTENLVDTMGQTAQELQRSVQPHLGQNVDVAV